MVSQIFLIQTKIFLMSNNTLQLFEKLLFTCNFILKRTNPVWNAKHRIWLWFKIKINLFFHWIDTICSDTWTRLTKCECSENWVYDQATVRKRIRYWSETLYVFLRRTGIRTHAYLQIVHRACLKMPSMSVLCMWLYALVFLEEFTFFFTKIKWVTYNVCVPLRLSDGKITDIPC